MACRLHFIDCPTSLGCTVVVQTRTQPHKMKPKLNRWIVIVLGMVFGLPLSVAAQSQCELHLDDVRSELQDFSRRFMNHKDPKLSALAAERLRTLPDLISKLRKEGQEVFKLSADEVDSEMAERQAGLKAMLEYGGFGEEPKARYFLCMTSIRYSQLAAARGGSGGGGGETDASQKWFEERADVWNRCGNALNAELQHKSTLGKFRVVGGDRRLDFGTPINEYCRKWMLRGYTFEGPQTREVRSSVKQVGEPRLEEDEPCPFVAANETPIGQCAVLKVKSLLDYSNPPFLLRQSLIRGYNKEQCFEYQIDLRFGCQMNTNTSYCIMDGEERQCLQRSGMPLWDPRKAQLPEAAAMTLYRDVGAGEYNTHGSALRLSGNIAGGPNIRRNVTIKARECRKPGVPTDFLEGEGCLVNRSTSLTTRWPFGMGDNP